MLIHFDNAFVLSEILLLASLSLEEKVRVASNHHL